MDGAPEARAIAAPKILARRREGNRNRRVRPPAAAERVFPPAEIRYDAGMEWRASHILVKDRRQAEEILRKIKQGANFESMAREFSTCPSKSKGGDLGWFGPGKMVAAFESACKRLGHGSLSDVVSTSFGYHIIKLTGRKD